MMGIHDVFPPDADNSNDPISEKTQGSGLPVFDPQDTPGV
jgi:hypothetical protein